MTTKCARNYSGSNTHKCTGGKFCKGDCKPSQLTPARITKLLADRDKLLTRRDGLYDSKRVARIEAQLAQVPDGQDNRVDLALGRSCAVLPERDEVRDGWFISQAVTVEQAAPIAQHKQDEFLENVKDQTDDFAEHMAQYGAEIDDTPRDWRDMRGDLAL